MNSKLKIFDKKISKFIRAMGVVVLLIVASALMFFLYLNITATPSSGDHSGKNISEIKNPRISIK